MIVTSAISPLWTAKCGTTAIFAASIRDPLHNECNKGFKIGRDLVVIFHHLRNCDGHLLMEQLGTVAELQGHKIDATAKAMKD